MSDADVSLIHDEDLLRRMWQQTEDFSRKKEIRTHMYRLREERLRSLYSPEPPAPRAALGKGVEAAQTHVKSFADQSFQGLKSKEVRDAGSPPKEFHYRGQDLKELSNAGWNVESENKTTDDGHTHVRAVHANIEGRYDVEGGAGKFAAVDHQKQAVTEYHDDNTSLKRKENSTKSGAQEQVVRKTDDGTEFSSTTSSSSASHFHQESSTKHEVPCTKDDYDHSRETNRNVERRQITKTNEFEQNLRRNDLEIGELVSRKVDYPDDNTKVIVETRCLEDGTRVTSTRREFKAPMHSTRSEQRSQTKSESKQYTSSQHSSDVKSTKITRECDSSTNIVDSQRHADEHDFKRIDNSSHIQQKNEEIHNTKRFDTRDSSSKITRETIDNRNDDMDTQRHDNTIKKSQQTNYATQSENYSTTERRTNQHYETTVNEIDCRESKKTTESKINQETGSSTINDDYSTRRTNRYETKIDESDSRDNTMSNDNKNIQLDSKDVHYNKDNKERTYRDRDQRSEDVIEKKISNNQYETTYQSDYNQKKISNDWSPSQQAWASTLRADTPASSRPTTRASSPGSKTYQSSTSSLRSSVSPDKHYMKPLSRGGSPSKADRSSPSRMTTDKYSSTQSAHTLTETKSNRYISPDRKPPVSSSINTDSSNRKPQHIRSSLSPEKRPSDYKPSTSPDRKPEYKCSPSEDSPRSQSPSRPYRSSISPKKSVPKEDLKRPSQSPDRKPGYMKPATSKPTTDSTPTQHNNPDTKMPGKHRLSQSPERKPNSKTTNIKEDHYKFVDEETKMYSRSDRNDIHYTKRTSPSPDRFEKSPSPTRKSPEDTTDFCRPESPIRPTLRKGTRSPSPPKGPVTFTDTTVTNTKTKYDNYVEDTKTSRASTIQAPRESSPLNYGTYDKKRNENVEEITGMTNTEDVKYNSLTRREKTSNKGPDASLSPTKKSPRDSVSPVKPVTVSKEASPTKYGTYDKKRQTEEVEEVTTLTKKGSKNIEFDSLTRRENTSNKVPDLLPARKSPRDSVSPSKSPIKDSKYKHTTDFIATERATEAINKRTTANDRPRQLVTPSTSPTRKPKTEETEPSTGQSSPTTSVSGFVYYSSPITNRTIVTDLDDVEFYSETNTNENITSAYKKPETLNVERSPSPSKIPCRSPSPEKRASPTKDSLPRKSSLKKPSTDFIPVSPVEKPPTTFRVSPTDEDRDFPEHKIVKKDRPEKPIGSPVKPKPPLERRETYEERCRKILGMVSNDTTTTVIQPKVDQSSPSVSPCRSPEPKEPTSFTIADEKKSTKVNVSEFITHEKEDTTEKARYSITKDKKTNKPSRDSSPTKLHDIISLDIKKSNTTTEDIHVDTISKTICHSPDREIGYIPLKDSQPNDVKPSAPIRTPSISPEREAPGLKSNHIFPTRKSHDRSEPSPSKEIPKKMPNEFKDDFCTRPSVSPERKPGYMRSTAATTTKFESSTTTKDIQNDTIFKTVRQKPQDSRPSHTSEHSKDSTPAKTNLSTEKPGDKYPEKLPRSSVSPDKNVRPTATTTIKYDSTTTTTEDVTSKTVREGLDRETGYYRRTSPSRPRDNVPTKPRATPERIPSSTNKPSALKSPTRSSTSPDRKPRYTKLTATTTIKNKETSTSEDVQEDSLIKTVKSKHPSPEALKHKSVSPQRRPIGTQRSYTPSPTRKTTTVTENVTEFIQSEREQEVLDRVQKSLRKLSPTRDQRSSSRERSPAKTTISLQDLDVTVENVTEDVSEGGLETDKKSTPKTHVTRVGKQADDKLNESKSASKPPPRTVSPTKKPTAPASSKSERSPDSTNKPRSISPKKPASPIERPQSPQVPKTSGIKPKESVSSQCRKSTPGNTSPTKTEKIPTELKKTTGVTKQNSFTKTATTKTVNSKLTTIKTEPELKRTTTPKGINKENVSPKKDDTKVTRTVSDISIKTKKSSPQRMKSKPEIQVSDLSTTKFSKHTTTNNKIIKSHTKLAPKPKSATALNTSTDDDDIIIDVEQAKSSRENSPDRICPTPVSLLEDAGTPRFPDEVSEPDDEFRKRTHHVIHETESLVDDIVEINEEEELFVKRTDVDRITESDECLLSVTDKVSKFTNKIDEVSKPKDTTAHFKDTERRVHSDFVDKNLKSDKCLLSVSEKVNKFAKGPSDDKDNRSPSRKIVDEYDTQTNYQDDYTKLSVNDKAHLFIETAENVKSPKPKSTQKVGRPDLTNIDESLKSDDCLLSVSDKVNKFVKTAEQFLTESQEVDDKEKKVKEQYEKLMKRFIQDDLDEDINTYDSETKVITEDITITEKQNQEDRKPSFAKETTSSHTKVKDYPSPNLKPTERAPIVKITTLRSSEAVKKAKALFENIATTQRTDTHTAKLTDIGVINKSPKTDSTIVLHPSLEDGSPNITDVDSEVDVPLTPTTKDRPSSSTPTGPQPGRYVDKSRSSPTRLATQSPDVFRARSPIRHTVETTTTKTVLSRYPAAHDYPKQPEKSQERIARHDTKQTRQEQDQEKLEKVPSYQRPTKTSNVKEEKSVDETEVSTRRGSGKFGVELRKTSLERSTLSSERRRSSTDHHQPCIEDIYELDLLEQMLEKVVGYEQRRRIRAQIRVAKKKMETEHTETVYSRSTKHTTVTKNKSPERRVPTKSPERRVPAKSPERQPKTTNLNKKTLSPERSSFTSQRIATVEHAQTKPLLNGHAKEPSNLSDKRHRPQSPQKQRPVPSPVRQPSPDKKTRTTPSKTPVKPKTNRFNEYASAYMKKVGLNEMDKVKFSDTKTKKIEVDDREMELCETRKSVEKEDYNSVERFEEKTESKMTSISKSFSERSSSKETIEVIQVNGKRSLSPGKQRSPQRRTQTPTERLYQRSPSPDFKRPKSDKTETVIRTVYETEPRVKETVIKTVVEERPSIKKETVVKTVNDVSKKVQPKQSQDEKPSWVMNRNLKKISSEARTFSSKKVESEKQKYRAPSPSKVISKPIDVITSSYGPGPLDADGRPLFGIKALRNGASNYQVKGTVVREEYHSRNGGEPQGSVSVTAYSTQPQDLERLLQTQGERPSRLHGLAAITTTKKFGGDSGTTLREAHSREERATLEQFTHGGRHADGSPERAGRDQRGGRAGRGEDKKTVRQSSVKSLTEKYIKTASEPKSERSAYPKAGLILRTTTMRDSVSSDSSAHAGLGRTDSAHSLNSVEDHTVTTTERTADGHHTTTTTTTKGERSFLDSSTKVTGVQDILTRMKNADIVIQEGDTTEDTEARALLNKFLGATVLMAGMQSYVIDPPAGQRAGQRAGQQEAARSASKPARSRADQATFDPDQCWDERLLRSQLEQSSDYEQRRRLRARIRTLMAEQEACASAVTEALGAAGSAPDTPDAPDAPDTPDAREEAEVTVTSSVRRNSSEKTVSSSTTTKSSKVIESMTRPAPKPVSPFAKFRQLEKQNPTKSPNSPKTPQSPGSPAQPIFKFTDPALQCSALTIKERLLQWCRDKTRDYENVKLENFSTSWADGLAFCALVHHFLPDAFDYSALSADKRRHNFTLAFKVADEKAGIYPLLDVDDMVAMRKPDWKCVFTYVQSIHRRFKDQQ